LVKFLRVLTLHHLATYKAWAPCVQCNRSRDLSTFVIAVLPLLPCKDCVALYSSLRCIPFSLLAQFSTKSWILYPFPSLPGWHQPILIYSLLSAQGAVVFASTTMAISCRRKCHAPKFISKLMANKKMVGETGRSRLFTGKKSVLGGNRSN